MNFDFNSGKVGFFLTTAAGTAGATASWTERFTICANGNVGIGNTGPSHLLSIKGTSGVSTVMSQVWNTNSSWDAYALVRAVSDTQSSGQPAVDWGFYRGNGTDGNSSSGYVIKTGSNTSTTTKLFVRCDGNVGIGTITPEAKLDIQDGSIALVMGADNNLTTLTDATTKTARMGVHNYTNAEEPLAIFTADSEQYTSTLSIGGGTSIMNATSFLKFFTALDGTTATGTERLRINNIGIVCSYLCFKSPVVCGDSCVSSPKVHATDFCFKVGTNGTFGTAQTMNANTSSTSMVQIGTNNDIDPYRDGDGSAGSGSTLASVLQVGSYNDNKAGATSATMIGIYNRICDTTTTNNVKHSDLLMVGHSNVIKNDYFADFAGTTGCYTEKGSIFGQYNTIDKTGIYCYDASNCYHYGSVAFGNKNCLKDVYNVAVGSDNITNYFGSIAVGMQSCACQTYSLAIGYQAKAMNQRATAIGFQAYVGSYGHMGLGLSSASAWVCTNGQICAVGDMVACTSDRRLKCNILTIFFNVKIHN